MEEIFNNLQQYFSENPEYIYLIIGVVFLVLAIGIIKNKNWAIDPSSTNQKMFYNAFGHNTFRYVIGFFYILGTLAGFGGFLLYFFK